MSRTIDADALKANLRVSQGVLDDYGIVYVPYRDVVACIDAAPTIEQEPARVMTREEIESADGYVWYEAIDTSILRVVLIRKRFLRIPFETPCSVTNLNWPRYGKDWRYWTAQPTDEQRKAVKWDAAD